MKYNKLALIPGDSLYPDLSALNPDSRTLFFMAEDRDLCTHFTYHKHKLVLFLSAMRTYSEELQRRYPVEYHQLTVENAKSSYFDKLKQSIKNHGIKDIITFTIEDKFFRQGLSDFCALQKLNLKIADSPGFLNSAEDFAEYLQEVKKPFMHNYYIRQRKKFNILMDGQSKPLNGKWSYDIENRKKLPENIPIPPLPKPEPTAHTQDVSRLVNEMFPSHPGSTADFNYATTRRDALWLLDHFLAEKFESFGPYEDAIDKNESFLFHSVLSPYLNLGLITPREVITRAVSYGLSREVHYPSLEGFVRQIIGWREFLRGIYNHFELEKNYFNHQNRLTADWYRGTTGILPLDDMIKKVTRHAYAHHIERLMVAGNIMLLSEIHPDEVYRWFMEMFVDSADWVMVPNVYGMSQFAEGGIFATKPYIAGSNYILKMSNYSRGEWCEPLDGLYWRFINKKRALFLKNPRMAVMVKSYERMDPARKSRILHAAEKFIEAKTLPPAG